MFLVCLILLLLVNFGLLQPWTPTIKSLDLLPVSLCILETSMSTKLPYQSKKLFPCLDIMAQKLTQLKNYAKNIRTVPRINARQIGQFRNAGAQLLQHERCPHGKNTTLTSSSMQTLHVFASFSWRFSSIKLRASEENSNQNLSIHNKNILCYVR